MFALAQLEETEQQCILLRISEEKSIFGTLGQNWNN